MVCSTRHLCRSARQLSRSLSAGPNAFQRPQQRRILRPFTTSIFRRADESSDPTPRPTATTTSSSTAAASNTPISEQDILADDEYLTPSEPYTAADLDPGQRADYDLLSKPEQAQYLKLENHFKAVLESAESEEELVKAAEGAERELERKHGQSIALEFPASRAKGPEVGFWAEDEDDEFGQMEDADDDVGDDYVSSVAESQIDLERDIREYTRIAAWDLPLLQQYVKPFQPPTHSTPLRFRYTTYMGETHPAARKVVVEFSTKDLLSNPTAQYKINEAQRAKLIKLVGVRYNPDTDIVKMSCEKFDSPAQNKRHLGDLINTLIREAKDKRDDFADVAFDFRHHKAKERIEYPEHWKLRTQTVERLARRREAQRVLLEGDTSKPVDGAKVVAEYVRVAPPKARLIK